LRNCRGRSWPINRLFRTTKVCEEDLVSLRESKQNRGRPLVWIGSILAWDPCAGKVNKILLGMTAKNKPLHERQRYLIERRNGTTSVGSDAKPSPKVWQSQYHVKTTVKDSSPFAMSVSGTFSDPFRQTASSLVDSRTEIVWNNYLFRRVETACPYESCGVAQRKRMILVLRFE